jgi:hypothetical protein
LPASSYFSTFSDVNLPRLCAEILLKLIFLI